MFDILAAMRSPDSTRQYKLLLARQMSDLEGQLEGVAGLRTVGVAAFPESVDEGDRLQPDLRDVVAVRLEVDDPRTAVKEFKKGVNELKDDTTTAAKKDDDKKV